MSKPRPRRSDFKPPLKRPADPSCQVAPGYISGKQRRLSDGPSVSSSNSREIPHDPSVLKAEIERLRERNHKLDEEIGDLHAKGFDDTDLKIFIDKLHKYNELKDIGQLLLGQLAIRQQVTTKDLYPKYGLELDD